MGKAAGSESSCPEQAERRVLHMLGRDGMR
jgi:hypothetical protein